MFYIGVTGNLTERIYTHKTFLVPVFTHQYKVWKLVYLEEYYDIQEAIKREKQLKNWHKDWKRNLVIAHNPSFKEILLG